MFAPQLFDIICDEILSDKGNAGMWRYSEVKGWISDPQMSEPFPGNGLCEGVEDVFVWECSIRQFLHLLKLCLSVVERQTAK